MVVAWGQARIEVDALREEILARLIAGWPVTKIYAELAAAGRITLSRRQFYHHVHRLESVVSPSTPPSPPSLPSPLPSAPTPPKPPSSAVTAAVPTLKFQQSADFKALWDGEDVTDSETP